MCYVPSENKLYCACSQADTVVVLDGTTHQVLARVGFGDSAGSFCYDSVDNKMYVANRGSASVSVLDCSDDRVVTTIDNVHNEFAWLASGMCFTPAHKTVYITSPGDTSVVAIDCSADTALARIPVGTESVALCHNLTNDRVYCRACWAGGGAVYGIDAATNQKVSVVQRGCGSVIACDPVRNVLFVPDDDTLVVVDCSAVAVADEVGPRRDAPTAQRMMHWPIRYTSRTMSRAEGIRESSPSSTVRATQCGSGIGRSMMWMRSVLPTHA
jgi:YVTN family beta-propeller protein